MEDRSLTIWIDESTEINIGGAEFNLIGSLISTSDKGKFIFLNRLYQARKNSPICFDTLHGCEIQESETRKLNLIKRWLKVFQSSPKVYYHCFLYRKNTSYVASDQTYEHYFAKQSVFSLANKMKSYGYPINTMFKNIDSLIILFDRRRAHTVETNEISLTRSTIERLNNLESVYRGEIKNQLSRVTGRSDIKVRFSFISSDCFDAMQFSDCFLYLVRKKLEQKENSSSQFTRLFDLHFLDDLDTHTRELGFKKIYEFAEKFNYFESNR